MSDPTATALALVEVSRTTQPSRCSPRSWARSRWPTRQDLPHRARARRSTPRGRRARVHVHVPVHREPGQPVRDTGRHPPRLPARTAKGQGAYSSKSPTRAARSSPRSKPRTCSRPTRSPSSRRCWRPRPRSAPRRPTEIGFPVAIKILSHDITHKSDVGGIALNVRSASRGSEPVHQDPQAGRRSRSPRPRSSAWPSQAMSRGGYEVIIGSKNDNTFGPALMFGMGGTGVELYNDIAIDFPPLNQALARADDPEHQGAPPAQRLPRQAAGRYERPRADAGEVQLPAGRLPRDRRDGRQPAAGAPRRPLGPRRTHRHRPQGRAQDHAPRFAPDDLHVPEQVPVGVPSGRREGAASGRSSPRTSRSGPT